MSKTSPHRLPLVPRASCLLPFLLAAATATPLLAQGKDMGQAQQYYKPKNSKFKFLPGPRAKGGEIRWKLPPGGRQVVEKDEYVILEPDVLVEYQDVKIHADKMTINLRTKDAV